jgi:molybdopterin-guanine dinucleotide biosynthesis protein A
MPTPPAYAAIIVAGGKSTRLGRDKASALLLGRPLLQHVLDRVGGVVQEAIIVRAAGQNLPSLAMSIPLRVVEDRYPNTGPLGGICTGLMATDASRSIAVACDMPLLSTRLVAELFRQSEDVDVVMPVREYPEPLHAVYSAACIPPMRDRLRSGNYKITGFLGATRVRYVREDELRAIDPEGRSFLNTNTEQDLLEVARIIEA